MVQLRERDPRGVGPVHVGPVHVGPGTGEAAAVLEVRLHSPRAEVVVVRVSGPVDEQGADLLGMRIAQQLTRATHVVVDLAGVSLLRNRGLQVLADAHRQAAGSGAYLHVTGIEDAAACDLLRAAELHTAPCPEGVVAQLPPRLPRRRPARTARQ